MSIVTISRGSYSHGGEVAEKVAGQLGYKCLSREILLNVSDEFNIPEIKLTRAIRDAPTLLDRYSFGREKYINYIRAAIVKNLREDNIVYHGFAGHFFVKDIPHVLKVRIIADLRYRVGCMIEREGVSGKDAENMIKELDEQRKKWSMKLYGIDTWDTRLYDLVINVNRITIDNAVKLICDSVRLGPFQTTQESQQRMDNLALYAAEKLKRETEPSPFLKPGERRPTDKTEAFE